MSKAEYKFIDTWAQPSLASMAEGLPEVRPLLERSGTIGLRNKDTTADELIEQMNKANVEKLFLCAWHRPGRWVIDNDTIASFVEQYPDRFVGVASVNLENPVEAVKQLDRAINDLNFKALRIVPWLWKLPPNDKLYYPLYVKCIELDIPFCTQIGHTGPLMPSEVGRLVPYLDEVLLTFPDLKVVGGHLGYPWTDETIGMMVKHKNFYIDTSAHLPKTYPKAILDYMKTWGRKKVMFGTNYPQLQLAKCTKQASALDLPSKVKRAFFYDNAKRLFKL